MSGVNWQCCCQEAPVCDYLCDGEDPLCDDQYTWASSPQFNIDYSRVKLNNTTQGCCFQNLEYNFTAVCTPIGQVILTRNENCCWVGDFEMRVTGTLTHGWDYDVFSGPPTYPNCNYTDTNGFIEDVPARYTVTCVGGLLKHQVTICHFQVACDTMVTYGDCEGSCPLDPLNTCCEYQVGLRCAGGTVTWYTKIQTAGVYHCPDGPVQIGPSICTCDPNDCAPNELPAMDKWCDLQGACGPTWFFGLYVTDTCSAQDPFYPCDEAFDANNGCPYIASIPYSSEGDWCSGNLDQAIVSCMEYNSVMVFDVGVLA